MSADNNIEGLRENLFDTMALLKAGRIDLATAKGISELGQVIINSAKVEIEHARQMKATVTTNFIPRQARPDTPMLPAPEPEPSPAKMAEVVDRPLPTAAQFQASPFGSTVQRLTPEDTRLPRGIIGVTRHSMGD